MCLRCLALFVKRTKKIYILFLLVLIKRNRETYEVIWSRGYVDLMKESPVFRLCFSFFRLHRRLCSPAGWKLSLLQSLEWEGRAIIWVFKPFCPQNRDAKDAKDVKDAKKNCLSFLLLKKQLYIFIYLWLT